MNIYEELGVKTGINAWGTITKIGGQKPHPLVLEAMAEASGYYVDVPHFHYAAGKKIAGLLNVPDCCITSGAAAGIAIGAAAAMTGTNIAKILKLPDTSDMANGALVLKSHRIAYDQAVLLSGARFKEIGSGSFACMEQVQYAIDHGTAFLFYVAEAEKTRGSIDPAPLFALMKEHNIPIIVDAAAEIPPLENIRRFLDLGADMVVFSGGKEIGGPQSSGLILGSKSMIEACRLNCCPNYGIGRPMKIDKETIAGILKAVELFSKTDYTLKMEYWVLAAERILKSLSDLQGARVKIAYPSEPGIQPSVIPRVYIKPLSKTAIMLRDDLLNNDPAVFAGIWDDELVINPQCLEEGEIAPLIQALKDNL